MTKKNLLSWQNFFALIVFLVGLIVCQYTGNRGIYPIDSFGHYDSGYRILNGEHPFRDYWIVSGFFIDYLQSIIFYLFGFSWQSYLLNASLLNGLASLIFYLLLKRIGLDFKISFFYAICFSILAYPSSGTPFVDHHSTFLSFISIMMLIYALKTNRKIFWVLIPTFLFLAFLSKQVPATYLFFTTILVIFFHLTHQKSEEIIKIFLTLFFTSLILLLCLLIFLKFIGVDKEIFLKQYILYPSSIGEERYGSISYNFKNIFLNFKFIYLSVFFLIFFTFWNLKNKYFYKDLNFKMFVICLFTFLTLVHHIILTKNQIFIFFLIPFILGFAHIQLENLNFQYKNYFKFILIFFCILMTLKYHLRFNIERKFHELNNVNFKNSVDPLELDKKFIGLKWISPKSINKKFIISEIDFLKRFRNILLNDKNKKIVITNYSIFSVITDENVSGYSRWYTRDGSAFPVNDNDFVQDYKNLIISFLKKKEIKNIYILPDVSEKNLSNYLDSKCYYVTEIELKIKKFEINNECDELFLWKKNKKNI